MPIVLGGTGWGSSFCKNHIVFKRENIIFVSKIIETMNHDVFISYSSKNKTTALAMCHVLEQHRVKCWMAPRDIPPGEDYGDVIDEAIIACRVFVIIFSEPAAVSPWVKGELNLAFTEQKHIVPYRIDDTRLKGAMRLILNQTHWIEAYPDAESKFDDLVTGIARYLDVPTEAGQSQADRSSVAAAAAATRPSAMKPKIYKVGDYYNENGREGVVFEVDATGRHGKVVGMKQAEKPWCRDEVRCVETGATDRVDGMKNMQQIMCITGWRESYPAFVWCANQGDGWYLPAIDELEKFMFDNKVHNAVNRTLSQYGEDMLVEKGIGGWYWSSSECGELCACSVFMAYGNTYTDNKSLDLYVRAVSAF